MNTKIYEQNSENKMNLLVANDDGIDSQGIRRLVEALSQVARVYVCAPDGERSASSHSITVRNPIRVRETQIPGAQRAMSFSGTPADCVKMGIQFLRKEGIEMDAVYSGINHGGNLGTDTLYSGTVGAAREGVLCGLPSVAVSVNSHKPEHFDTACRLALAVLPRVKEGLPAGTLLNINVPNLPSDQVRGLICTGLGIRQYVERFEEAVDEEGDRLYWYRGLPVEYECDSPDNDVLATQMGYAVMTPLQYDLTDYDLLDKIREWEIQK